MRIEFCIEATIGTCKKPQKWKRTWYVGKTESQPVSTEPCVLGHVVKVRLGRLAGDSGRCLVGHGMKPGFLGLTFNLEIISKLQKSEIIERISLEYNTVLHCTKFDTDAIRYLINHPFCQLSKQYPLYSIFIFSIQSRNGVLH